MHRLRRESVLFMCNVFKSLTVMPYFDFSYLL